MSRVEFSEKAATHLRDLVAERGADDYLLDRLAEQLEIFAEQPATLTEVAKLPYPPNRLMANIDLSDATARVWGFTVTLRRTQDEEGIYILTINGAPRG